MSRCRSTRFARCQPRPRAPGPPSGLSNRRWPKPAIRASRWSAPTGSSSATCTSRMCCRWWTIRTRLSTGPWCAHYRGCLRRCRGRTRWRGCAAPTATWRWSRRPTAAWSPWSRWRTWSRTWSAPFATARTVSEAALATCRLRSQTDWLRRAAAHTERAEEFLAPHLRRARAGEVHPVWDFLFTYYSLRPRQLRVWHAGYGVVLGGPEARSYLRRAGYGPHRDGVTVTDEYLRARTDTVAFVARLLRATAARPAHLNCFGLHEWAMVYRTDDVRHDRVPLRLGTAGTDAVGRFTAVALQPLRRIPLLHPGRRTAQRRHPDAGHPAGHRTARVPSRAHGSVQMAKQDRPAY